MYIREFISYIHYAIAKYFFPLKASYFQSRLQANVRDNSKTQAEAYSNLIPVAQSIRDVVREPPSSLLAPSPKEEHMDHLRRLREMAEQLSRVEPGLVNLVRWAEWRKNELLAGRSDLKMPSQVYTCVMLNYVMFNE